MSDSEGKVKFVVEIPLLTLSVVFITLLHYISSDNSPLLHEISQRLYYIPIVYAAYRLGLKGSLGYSILSGSLYLLHISEHRNEPQSAILNQYAEIIMFQVVGIATGFFARAERQQRQRFEKASADLAVAYQKLKDTVNLLVRTARLKSLGELAATVAHEIRNPLGAIKGAIEIIEKEIPLTSPRREFVTIIEREVDRLNRLVNEFLKFSKPRQPEKADTDLNQLIKSVLNFITPQAIKMGVKLVPQLDERLPLVFVDAEQIKQVLLNLILNAIQAMPAGGNVEVVSCRLKESVEISVHDYGVGIEPNKKERIFDPFFTTKPDGSGLGLSIAYQLIKQHDGELELVDQADPGSLFIVRLPLSNTNAVAVAASNQQKALTDNS
ncbi:MAG: ATP-binding protein [Acidobacteriota bacterium]